MCGRFTLIADENELIKEFQLTAPIDNFMPSYNIAPSQSVLAIIHDGHEKRAGYISWGLIPSWAKDQRLRYQMINARSETAHEKPSFKKLMAKKRCLIIADSFYEWKNQDGTKQPYRIQHKNRKLFAFAGLWDLWEKEGQRLFTCTILTKDANPSIRSIHHRMPIILPKDKEDAWITPYVKSPLEAKRFLDSFDDEPLNAYPVTSYVNKAQNNDGKCIEPLVEQ